MNKISIFDADKRHLVHAYRSTKQTITIKSRNIAFNKLCLRRNISQKYANINLKNSSYPTRQTRQKAEKIYKAWQKSNKTDFFIYQSFYFFPNINAISFKIVDQKSFYIWIGSCVEQLLQGGAGGGYKMQEWPMGI